MACPACVRIRSHGWTGSQVGPFGIAGDLGVGFSRARSRSAPIQIRDSSSCVILPHVGLGPMGMSADSPPHTGQGPFLFRYDVWDLLAVHFGSVHLH
jgi:hypothetical protein